MNTLFSFFYELFVGKLGSLCRAPARCVGPWHSVSGPALRRSVSDSGALCRAPAVPHGQFKTMYHAAYMLDSEGIIEILLKNVGNISIAQQPARDSA